MKSIVTLIGMLILSTVAWSDDESRYQAVGALGELNGVALQCRFLDQVRRMKGAVVAYAPKERSYGLAFDEATNTAFLAFARRNDSCPVRAEFEQEVGRRIEHMAQIFVIR
ncbi:MAG: hypothetical protein KDI82_07305 [Gammaproteobacteria bacterium]|nr:hypothetical protein [Gammaproteobacteria bacterium]